MLCLEEKLRPRAAGNPWAQDIFGMGLLLGLAAMLVPAWDTGDQRYISDVAGQMASFYLLPAMGFLLCLRCGAIDLSVWAAAALGGMVAAGLIAADVAPVLAFAAALGSGLALGVVNGALVAGLRLPSAVVSLAVAFAVVKFGIIGTSLTIYVSFRPSDLADDLSFSQAAAGMWDRSRMPAATGVAGLARVARRRAR